MLSFFHLIMLKVAQAITTIQVIFLPYLPIGIKVPIDEIHFTSISSFPVHFHVPTAKSSVS